MALTPFAWECPFCKRATIITGERCSSTTWSFTDGNLHGAQWVKLRAITCPNPECREYTLGASLHDQSTLPGYVMPGDLKKSWSLVPQAHMKVFPDYVPVAIRNDYTEACAIRDLSPKASATLSRRCLQGIIRDFWGIKKGRLVDEIEALEDKVDAITWNAIDAVRNIGNIGAHMERDINLIVEVDPDEAQLLIGLIETLITEWYIGRHERERRMRSLVAVSDEKKRAKTAPPAGETGGSESRAERVAPTSDDDATNA